MIQYLRNPLVVVWAVLVATTLAAWIISSKSSAMLEADAVVTAAVLVIAACKAQLVVMYFMEVRLGPVWLKLVTYGWVLALTGVLLMISAIQL